MSFGPSRSPTLKIQCSPLCHPPHRHQAGHPSTTTGMDSALDLHAPGVYQKCQNAKKPILPFAPWDMSNLFMAPKNPSPPSPASISAAKRRNQRFAPNWRCLSRVQVGMLDMKFQLL